ncbi:MAG: flotillin-like FloA family protein [Candidatus Riflebacteria bacterium]|nr:flotillin-like FloA family protein [Candidatus Riflebacteria bacterium]
MHIILAVVLILTVLVGLYAISLFPFMTYLNCISANVPISAVQLIAMQLRAVPTNLIVESYVRVRKAGVPLALDRLEVHYLSGGNMQKVVQALISAKNSKIDLDFERAAAIDLAGRDVEDAVKMSVHPRVIKTADIRGISRDGIELIVKANITVRSNLKTMVGGAGEDTVLARVSEGIVSAIGSAASHQVILNKPEILSQKIISAGLDVGTAFEIVSLDISDIDVGRNIGAHLKNAQAVADKKVGEAKAEGRRALAMALTQENKAAEQEAKANLVRAEMKIPFAIADAFRRGKIVVKRKKKQPPVDRSGLGFGDDAG